MWTYDEAKYFSDKVGGKVVGSVKNRGKSNNDVDILVSKWSDNIELILKNMEYEFIGSQVVSPDEIRKSRKFGKNSKYWLRNRRFKNYKTNKVIEVWNAEYD